MTALITDLPNAYFSQFLGIKFALSRTLKIHDVCIETSRDSESLLQGVKLEQSITTVTNSR
jgi:hypothetical protein